MSETDHQPELDEDMFHSALQFPSSGTNPMDEIPTPENNAETPNSADLMQDVPIEEASNPEVNHENHINNKWTQIQIVDTCKVGDGISAYVTYNITALNQQGEKSSVARRFSEFIQLHQKLSEIYLKQGYIIPPTPEKSVIGATKVKITQTDDTDDFIEKRKRALQRFLVRLATHPVLGLDRDFNDFMSNTDNVNYEVSNQNSPGTVLRLLNKMGATVNRLTYKMDESDPWFDNTVQTLHNLEGLIRHLSTHCDTMTQSRRDLSILSHSVALSTGLLGQSDPDGGALLHKLAAAQERCAAQVVRAQADTDAQTLSERLKEYLALLGAVKGSLHERTKLFQHWQHAQLQLAKKREARHKLVQGGSGARQDRVDQAGLEVNEWESKVERGQDSFDKISQQIKAEMERFEQCRIEDFKAMFIDYLEQHLEHQQQLAQCWEAFLPEAKAIA